MKRNLLLELLVGSDASGCENHQPHKKERKKIDECQIAIDGLDLVKIILQEILT